MPKNEFTCDCNVVHRSLVDAALSEMPDEEVIARLASFYKMMGDGTRCRIICALRDREMCVCDLCNVLSMSKSSVSHQLSKMRDSGIVKCVRRGREVYYSLDDGHVCEIFATTVAHIDHKRGGR